MVRYCRNIINGFGYKDSDYGMAISEYGWSSANANLLGKKDCTVKQAALDLRSYMVLKCADFDTVNYKYDFMDDGLRENGKEYNFGMINWSGHSTPYSAKEGYVAASAFNNMTNDAVALDEVYSKDYSKIMKFTYPTGSVYALWTANSSASDSVEFDLGASPVFYDMYGNILDRESVIGADGKYLLTDIPFFAAVGKEITYAAHNGEDDENIKISGSISSGRENVRVSLTVLPSDAAFDSNMYGNIAYMNQAATRNNGEFDFVLNGLDRNSTYTAYVVAADADFMDAKNWAFTPFIKFDAAWEGTAGEAWGPYVVEEGNMLINRDNELVMMLRYNSHRYDIPESNPAQIKSIILKVDTENPSAPLTFKKIIPFNGTFSKFYIRYDEKTDLYYAMLNRMTTNKIWQRNVLSLYSSYDLENWKVERDLINLEDAEWCESNWDSAVQYPTWLIEGEDIIAAARAAADPRARSATDWRARRSITAADTLKCAALCR